MRMEKESSSKVLFWVILHQNRNTGPVHVKTNLEQFYSSQNNIEGTKISINIFFRSGLIIVMC